MTRAGGDGTGARRRSGAGSNTVASLTLLHVRGYMQEGIMGAEREGENVARTAIVTGAARGIGLATARRLASDGHRVVLVDIDGQALEVAASEIPGSLGYRCDITDVTEPEGVFARVEATFGPVEILVNNAGIAGRTATIEWQTDEDWQRALSVMLTAPFRWSRAAVPIMRVGGWGRIINVASVAGKEGNPNIIPYSVA